MSNDTMSKMAKNHFVKVILKMTNTYGLKIITQPNHPSVSPYIP